MGISDSKKECLDLYRIETYLGVKYAWHYATEADCRYTRAMIRIMTSSNVKPPEGLPGELAASLAECSDRQPLEVVHDTQHPLSEPPSLTDAVEAREDEELVRIEDHGAYEAVIVERPGATGEAHGPFAYHVRWKPDVDGEGGRYQWQYLGRVTADSGGG